MIFRLIFNSEFMNYENSCGGLMEDNAFWYFQVNNNECNFSPDRIQYIFSMLESLVCSRCQASNYQFLFILNKYLLLYTKLFYEKINVLFDGLAATVHNQNYYAPSFLSLFQKLDMNLSYHAAKMKFSDETFFIFHPIKTKTLAMLSNENKSINPIVYG